MILLPPGMDFVLPVKILLICQGQLEPRLFQEALWDCQVLLFPTASAIKIQTHNFSLHSIPFFQLHTICVSINLSSKYPSIIKLGFSFLWKIPGPQTYKTRLCPSHSGSLTDMYFCWVFNEMAQKSTTRALDLHRLHHIHILWFLDSSFHSSGSQFPSLLNETNNLYLQFIRHTNSDDKFKASISRILKRKIMTNFIT